jgi:hypothetical protein
MFSKYCTVALALLAASVSANPFAAKQSPTNAKAAYISKLVKNAVPTKNSQIGRKLGGDDDAADVEIDISGYSLRFEKCQFVKAYDQDLADAGANTVLATQRFVIFRLCPSGSCKSCNTNYGEYIVDMEEYLAYTVEYRQDEQTEMCDTCEEQCYYAAADDAAAQGDDANADADEAEEDGDDERRLAYTVDCDTCQNDCQKIENMEANYYLDATTMIECQQLRDADDDGTGALWAGPICASQGSKIKIGVFSDEDCMFLDSSLDVENYLSDEDGNAMKLSHALLKTTYDVSDCIDCTAENDGDDDGVEVKEVCAELYEVAGKCEDSHGFDNGVSSNQYYDGQNQIDNEELVCEFISSLKSGTYSQDGEIVIGGSKVYTAGGTSTTGGQKFALTFFIIGTVGLAVYAAMLHSQLTKGGKADLSAQGGAMA